jgi:S-adenosylmethionine:tRNA ribosyltransferase-isomerase
MRLDAFDYELPEPLIAQVPLEDRTASRLMVVDRPGGELQHAFFKDLPEFLDERDVLVVNRSRVVPARLFVQRKTGGRVEILYTRSGEGGAFTALANPIRKLEAGDVLTGGDGAFAFRVLEKMTERELRLEMATPQGILEVLDRYGHTPLPPYIRRPDEPSDRGRYQTVFAEENGSVAAPTAGLHFSDSLVDGLRSAGIRVMSVVLHVGLGTFLPLERDAVEKNVLPGETYSIEGRTARELQEAKEQGKRIVAVGTTVTRVLETAFRRGLFESPDAETTYSGETNLFIYPGVEINFVDRLITNFHLPRSSLLLLVCALLGTDRTLACYREAVARKYRFFSYGDAMLIR